jgi:hypothetical protein
MKKMYLLLVSVLLATALSTGGCGTAHKDAVSPASTSETNSQPEQTENRPLTVPEVEKLAGFDVKEPSYLPDGVSLDFATYQKVPSPNVTSHFKIVHEQYGDMGQFFQIMQEPQTQAPPDTVSCGETATGCEAIQIGDVPAVYRLNSSGDKGPSTEELNWYENGFAFRLLRTAGEPNKIYKEELLKVANSLK